MNMLIFFVLGMDNLGTFSINGIPTVSGIDRSVSVDVFIGKDGRVKIDAVCVALSEKVNEKVEDGDENLEDGKIGNEKKELKGGMTLELDFTRNSLLQEEIMEHFEKLKIIGIE